MFGSSGNGKNTRFKWCKTPGNIDGEDGDKARSNIPSLFSLPPMGPMLRGAPRGPEHLRYPSPRRARGAPPGFSDLAYPARSGPPFIGLGGSSMRGFGFQMGRGGPPVGISDFPMGRGGPLMGSRGPPMSHCGFSMGRGGFPVGGNDSFMSDLGDQSEYPPQMYNSQPVHREIVAIKRADNSTLQKMKCTGKKKKKRKLYGVQNNSVKTDEIPVLHDERKQESGEPLPKRRKIVSMKNRYLIDRIVTNLMKPRNYKAFQDTLMYSQWFLEVPPDFGEDWMVVPCPPGKRMLIVAGKGITRSFAKGGDVIYSFYSALPGGHPFKGDECKKSVTILDCFWHHKSRSYYVLDVLHWNNIPLLNSEAAFRFSWLEQKLSENPELSEVSEENEYCFQYLPRYSCGKDCISEVMSRDPLVFNDLTVIVDGFMFYNASSIYHSGVCPDVGWLKPFMVPDVLKLDVCSELLVDRPHNYVGVQEFIEEFEKEKKKVILRERKMRRLKFGEDVPVKESKRGDEGKEKEEKEGDGREEEEEDGIEEEEGDGIEEDDGNGKEEEARYCTQSL